mgnify:CR=1 FL=1
MISGGDFRVNLRSVPPFQIELPIDFDENKQRGVLPNAASQPIPEGNKMVNDSATIRLEDIPSADPKFKNETVRAIRVQANSEVPGLFGKKNGGWSRYSIVIEETNLAYAQEVIDGARGVYGDVYRLNNPQFGGAAERALEIAVEIVGAHEGSEKYQKGLYPSFQLTGWIVKNPELAKTSLPKDLLAQTKTSLEVGPQKASVDVDHDDKRFEPGVTLIHAHENTKFASFDAVMLWRAFQSRRASQS